MNKKRFEALQWASSFLKNFQRDENAGEILLQHRLGLNRTNLIVSLQDPLAEEDWLWFKKSVTEHAVHGIPVQHITGVERFYGRTFKVNEHVLVPRPETEEVVQCALEKMKHHFGADQPIAMIDIGTGSGIIAITIAKERATVKVTGVDISSKALKVAEDNARKLDADVRFVEGDVLQPFLNQETFDVVISNPPYISKQEMASLQDVVSGYDPHLALTDQSDGLSFYRRIITALPSVMKDKLLIVFEIGHTQGKEVTEMLKAAFPHSLQETEILKDINGKDRMISAWLAKPVKRTQDLKND